MATTTLSLFFSSICQQAVIPSVESAAAWIWFVIKFLWPWYWFLITVAMFGWIIIEVVTKHGGARYKSENGFSPLFNSFVGGGFYALLQYVTHLILNKFFGPAIYCQPWAYLIHTIIFITTGYLLWKMGFWVYWRLPGSRRRRYK